MRWLMISVDVVGRWVGKKKWNNGAEGELSSSSAKVVIWCSQLQKSRLVRVLCV